MNKNKLVTLAECPPGLFIYSCGGCKSLGFKSEYISGNPGEYPFIEAFVVESGEYFWGGAPTRKDRAQLLVEPVDITQLRISEI